MKFLIRASIALLVTIACATAMQLPAQAASKVGIRGTVACPSGKVVVGVWVESSGGGSGFAAWSAYPGARTIARFSRTFTTNLATNVHLNVGCGGKPSKWGSSSRTPKVVVSSASVLHYNVECGRVGSCALFRNDDNVPASPSKNPTSDRTQCTHRASDFFNVMTGRHRNFYGDAHYWDTAAASVGWTVRSWPRPDSIAVWQPGQAGASGLGHVAYVADTRVESGKLQMKIYDRNWIRATDRNALWVDFSPGLKFIVAAPRVHRAY
jgi:hypothetical protein